MKKDSKLRKLLCIVCCAAIFTGLAAGCGTAASNSASSNAKTSTDTSTANTSSSIDISKSLELQFYMVGNAPKDMDVVAEQVNKLAKQDLNCTVKFNFTTWTNYSDKYNTILCSGESVDLMYTAPWISYGKYAKKGAFMALNDLLPDYAPDLYAFVPENYWNLCKTDGNIYTIPSTYEEYISGGLMYREDLRKLYDLPVPDSFENCEAYMQGIKDNMPGQLVTEDMGSNFLQLEGEPTEGESAEDSYNCGLRYNYYNPTEVTVYWGTDQFISDMKDIKRWADLGFWSKSIMSDSRDLLSDFYSGKTVITKSGLNPNKYVTAKLTIAQSHPEWEITYVPEVNYDGVAYTNHPLHNGYAVPISSKNPERALMFYEKVVLDQTYNQLTQYGIEGTNYTVENGLYKQIGDGFGYEGMNGWSWRNPSFMLKTENTDELYSIFDQLDKVTAEHPKYKADITEGFFEDTTDYENELAALNNIKAQYLNPLLFGLVNDVEEATALFMEKATAAGLEKIQEGWKTQWLAYCEEYGF